MATEWEDALIKHGIMAKPVEKETDDDRHLKVMEKRMDEDGHEKRDEDPSSDKQNPSNNFIKH